MKPCQICEGAGLLPQGFYAAMESGTDLEALREAPLTEVCRNCIGSGSVEARECVLAMSR